MDPNANLAEQNRIIVNMRRTDLAKGVVRRERSRLAELREALITWLQSGGFAPSWGLYPDASPYFAGRGLYVVKPTRVRRPRRSGGYLGTWESIDAYESGRPMSSDDY